MKGVINSIIAIFFFQVISFIMAYLIKT